MSIIIHKHILSQIIVRSATLPYGFTIRLMKRDIYFFGKESTFPLDDMMFLVYQYHHLRIPKGHVGCNAYPLVTFFWCMCLYA